MNRDKVLSLDLIEPEVLELYKKVRQDYPDAFLAGGYLRDRYLELTPKDVDIFTFAQLLDDRTSVPAEDDASGGGDTRLVCVEPYIDHLAVSHGVFKYPVEIIHLANKLDPDPRTEVECFIFGCMQIIYDTERGFVDATQAFWHDIQNQRMTVCRGGDANTAYVAYQKYDHLKKRLHGWRLAVPKKWAGYFDGLCEFGDHPEQAILLED